MTNPLDEQRAAHVRCLQDFAAAYDTESANGLALRAAIAALTAPPLCAKGEIRLWDSQWVNVVNHANCYADFTKEEAVHEAVKRTEQYMLANITAGFPPPRTTPAQPADGVEAMAPAAAVAYACLRESGYHEAAANLREYLRIIAASKADSAQPRGLEPIGVSRPVRLDDFIPRHFRGLPVTENLLHYVRAFVVACDSLNGSAAPTPQPEGGRGEADFTGWLEQQMPPGTVISDPRWWASRILRALGRATPTDAARVRDAWLPIESAPQDGTLGPIGESPKTIADEMEAWSEKKMSANGSSRIDRALVREWAKRLRGEA